MTLSIRKNDTIIVISGKDRGTKGKVLRVLPTTRQIVVEGVRLAKRHQRPRTQGQKGQIISREMPFSVANVQLLCPQCGKQTRIGYQITGDVKTRVCRKCKSPVN